MQHFDLGRPFLQLLSPPAIGNYRHKQERADMALVRDRALDGEQTERLRKPLDEHIVGLKSNLLKIKNKFVQNGELVVQI